MQTLLNCALAEVQRLLSENDRLKRLVKQEQEALAFQATEAWGQRQTVDKLRAELNALKGQLDSDCGHLRLHASLAEGNAELEVETALLKQHLRTAEQASAAFQKQAGVISQSLQAIVIERNKLRELHASLAETNAELEAKLKSCQIQLRDDNAFFSLAQELGNELIDQLRDDNKVQLYDQ